MADTTETVSRMDRTSCTRIICAPFRTAIATAPAVPYPRSCTGCLHQSTNELFARQSDEHWIPKVRQSLEISQQLKIMLLKLTKTKPGVKNDLASADPLLDRHLRPFT